MHKNELYEVPLNLLKKYDIETFNNIIKLNNIDNKKYINTINNETEENLSDASISDEDGNERYSKISK